MSEIPSRRFSGSRWNIHAAAVGGSGIPKWKISRKSWFAASQPVRVRAVNVRVERERARRIATNKADAIARADFALFAAACVSCSIVWIGGFGISLVLVESS